MWFLEADIALRLLGGCLLWAILSMLARKFWPSSTAFWSSSTLR